MISSRYIILDIPYEEDRFQPWEFDVPESLKAAAQTTGRIRLKIDINNGYIYDWPGEQPGTDWYWTVEYTGAGGSLEIRSEDMQLLASADHMVNGPLCVRDGALLIRGLGANVVNLRYKEFSDEWNWIVPEANPAYMPAGEPSGSDGAGMEIPDDEAPMFIDEEIPA